MPEYLPSPTDWVREQVELYESSGGTQGLTLRDTGLPVIVVTNRGNLTGGIRKTPLMRVKDGNNYVLVGSKGGAPKNPDWVYNLRTCVSERLKMTQNGPACGTLLWPPIRPMKNTRPVPAARFPCSSLSQRSRSARSS